jgi:uncharacterized protein with HEPN domain
MPRRRLSRPALQAILRSIEAIEAALSGKSFVEFEADWLLNHGVQRGIEIISEATRRLPTELLAQHPEIAWSDIRGIGNVLRHDYDAIVSKVIYDAATTKLAALKAAVLVIDANLDEPSE